MRTKHFDVDIDTVSTFNPSSVFGDRITKASIIKDEKIQPHPCGVYFQEIAKDPISKLAAMSYEDAEEAGYFKVDFLHLNIYNYFESKDEIRALLKQEPDWTQLNSPSTVKNLFQLAKHYDTLSQVKPTSILELADVLAMIRPGKINILKLYLRDREKGRKELYKQDADGFTFKKAHAISYALVVVLQLHLISAGIIK